MLPEVIDGARIRLTKIKREEAEEIFYAYASKEKATRFVSWKTHERMDDSRAFTRWSVAAWENNGAFTYVVRLKPYFRLIGSLGLLNLKGSLQLGYIFSPSCWGQGLALESTLAIIPYIIDNHNFTSLWSFVDKEHLPSQKVLLKSGFMANPSVPMWHRFVNQGDALKPCLRFEFPLHR